jgi:hypothetical protein
MYFMYTACPMSLRVCGQFGTLCIWCVNVMIYRNITHVPEVTESASMNVAFCVCVRIDMLAWVFLYRLNNIRKSISRRFKKIAKSDY